MAQMSEKAAAMTAAAAAAEATNNNMSMGPDAAAAMTKKRGTKNVFKVALYMLRRNKKEKSVQVDLASKGTWKRVLGSMRPLHLQSNQSPPPAIAPAPLSPTTEKYEDVFPSPMFRRGCPSPYAASDSGEEDQASQYASAVNLLDLCKEDEDCRDNIVKDVGEDEMIDAKAEEFIAQFYEQMRLQRSDSVDHYYQDR